NEKDIIAQQSKKRLIRDLLKTKLSVHEKDILPALNDDRYILIAPTDGKIDEDEKKWRGLVKKINEWLESAHIKGTIFIGIGGVTSELKHYYESYQQAVQTLNVLFSQRNNSNFAFFEQLGSYVLLHDLKESNTSSLFINKHLGKL